MSPRLKLYLDGKMQRYTLLFSVNGGVFAIVQLLPRGHLALDLGTLAIGAALFTVLMTADIWLWGADMRNQHGHTLFRPVGQGILLMIGALLVGGWILSLDRVRGKVAPHLRKFMSLFREPANKAMQGHADTACPMLCWHGLREEMKKSGFIQQAIERDNLKGAVVPK